MIFATTTLFFLFLLLLVKLNREICLRFGIIFSTSLFLSTSIFSQTFEKSFEEIEKIYSNPTDFPSTAFNYNNQIHSYIAPLMCSYLEMYEASLNKHYLDLFITQAKMVVDRRDDNLKILFVDKPENERIPISNLQTGKILEGGQVPLNGDKAWGGYNEAYYDANPPHAKLINAYWAAEHVSNGIISFPLIKFAYLIKHVYPQLKTLEVPENAKGKDASSGLMITTYGDFAELMQLKIHETIHDHFGKYWDKKQHCYVNTSPSGPKKSGHANLNYHTSLGRPAVYLYALYKADNNQEFTSYYQELVSEILNRLTSPKKPVSFTRENHIVSWRYTTPKGSYEDIAHGLLSFQFVDLIHHFEVPNFFKTKILLVPNDLMFDFANTFQQKFVKGPQCYWLNISGDDIKAPNQPIPVGDNPFYDTIRKIDQYSNAGRAVFLSKHIPDLYPFFADYFYEFALYGSTSSPKYLKGPFNLSMVVDAVAGVAHYGKTPEVSNHFDIKGVSRSHPYDVDNHFTKQAKYIGVTSGEFDGNKETIEIATIQADSRTIMIHTYNDSTHQIIRNDKVMSELSDGNWSSIASGNVITNNQSDEIVAINQKDKSLNLIHGNGTIVNKIFTGKEVIHIAVGNIDNQPGDEIVCISKDKGEISIFKYTHNLFEEQVISNQELSRFQIPTASGIAIGNLDNDSTNGLEIIVINNNNIQKENIQIFNYDSKNQKFYDSIISYKGTNDKYSNWDGISVGDYNADDTDEIMLHRKYDGDFFVLNLERKEIKVITKDFFPENWEMGTICKLKTPQNEADYMMSIRNYDGDFFVYGIMNLPVLKK